MHNFPFGSAWAKANTITCLTSIEGKEEKERDLQRANLVGKVIRLFTNVQPIEDIYISPEAHESWPAVPALRLLLCLFGLRQTVIWCSSNTLQYNLTCQMVQSINNPLWPMGSCVWGFQIGEWENTLCSREKCLDFAFILYRTKRLHLYTYTTRVIPKMLTSSVNKIKVSPIGTIDHCVKYSNSFNAWRTPSDD